MVQTTMLEDVSHATRCCSLHTSTSTQDSSVVHAPILPHSNLSWQTSNKTCIVLPVLTLFFFFPFFSFSTPPQPWSSKPNYVPSRNPVSTLDTAPCAADVTGKRSGWAPKKPNLCTNKEKSHKSWPGHKPGDVFTRKTWTTDKRKK